MAAARSSLRHGPIWLLLPVAGDLQELCSDRLSISSMRVKSLTLSSVSLMLRKKPLQRRRENVQRQLSLWPEEKRLNLWEGLDPGTQKKVIALLSRLIEKTVRPHDETQNDAIERA
jgi:hypothetical protein